MTHPLTRGSPERYRRWMTLISTIRNLARSECQRKENAFEPCFFEEHLAPVAHYAVALANHLKADREIVELAAYLHDLAAVRDAGDIPQHAKLGGDLARRILIEHGCSAAKAAKVARCVASHSEPVQIGSGALEEVCVSNADAMAQITRPAYWLFYAIRVRKMGFSEARQWVLQRVTHNWDSLVSPARHMIEEEYARAAGLLAA